MVKVIRQKGFDKTINFRENMSNLSIIITVVICTYNNAKFLERTLASLTQQQVARYLEWSVLVVDNNSTDETPEVVERYQKLGKIPKLRIVHESKQGLSYARRRAVCETSSDLIAFVDDDCLLSPDWLQQAITFCQEYPKAGAVGSRVTLLWEVPPKKEILQFEGYLSSYNRGDLPAQMPSIGETYLVGAGLVVRRSALLASGWLEKMALVGRNGKILTAGDDSEMVLRIRNAGYELWYNPAMQLQHYIPQQRMSFDYICRLLRGIGQSRSILYVLGNRLQPTLRVRCIIFGKSVRYLSRVILSIAYRNILRVRSLPPDRLVYLYDAIGNVEGSINLLFYDYKI